MIRTSNDGPKFAEVSGSARLRLVSAAGCDEDAASVAEDAAGNVELPALELLASPPPGAGGRPSTKKPPGSPEVQNEWGTDVR